MTAAGTQVRTLKQWKLGFSPMVKVAYLAYAITKRQLALMTIIHRGATEPHQAPKGAISEHTSTHERQVDSKAIQDSPSRKYLAHGRMTRLRAWGEDV